jgi:hypothetical protein
MRTLAGHVLFFSCHTVGSEAGFFGTLQGREGDGGGAEVIL